MFRLIRPTLTLLVVEALHFRTHLLHQKCAFGRSRKSIDQLLSSKYLHTYLKASSSGSATPLVKAMSPQDFGKILKDPSVANFQVIDVREPDELKMASVNYSGVINLPLSQYSNWSPKILAGEMLDATKPTICLVSNNCYMYIVYPINFHVKCHHGMRSMRMATFLVQQAGFIDVNNVSGGIHQFAISVDPSVPTY